MNLKRKNSVLILVFIGACLALGLSLSMGNDLSKCNDAMVENKRDTMNEDLGLHDSTKQSNFVMPDYNEQLLKQKAAAQAQGMTPEQYAEYEAQRQEYERQKAEYERQKAAYEAENGPQPASMTEALEMRMKQIEKEYRANLKKDSISKSNATAK